MLKKINIAADKNDEETTTRLTFELDLTEYCQLCVTKDIQQDPINKQHLQKNFKQLREQYIDALSNSHGDMIWREQIKPYCLDNLKKEPPEVEASSTHNEKLPHVLSVLDDYFVELLKNSMDAIISNHISGQSQNTVLELEIRCTVTKQNITLHIIDNAGGFSEEALAKVHADLISKDYTKKRRSSDKQEHTVLFGGAGVGLAQFFAMFLDGISLGAHLAKSNKVLDVPPHATSIAIHNTNHLGIRGAEIICTSPHEPFNKYTPPEKSHEDPLTTLCTLTLNLPPNKKAQQRRNTASVPSLQTDTSTTDTRRVFPLISGEGQHHRIFSPYTREEITPIPQGRDSVASSDLFTPVVLPSDVEEHTQDSQAEHSLGNFFL